MSNIADASAQRRAAPVTVGRVSVDGFDRVTPLKGEYYLTLLKALHIKRDVVRYLEIGTQYGKSLELARARGVAVDPNFLLDKEAWAGRSDLKLFEMTSDAFFAAHDPRDSLGGAIDLAFIDGMHLSEFVLRDFANVERHCSADALIAIHDVLPRNFEMTERDRRTAARRDKAHAFDWTGDVWRVLPMLRRERPDLLIEVLDCPPTGLALISHLDPSYQAPDGWLNRLVDELIGSEPAEAEFWSFIESVSVADSRSYASTRN